MISSNQIHYFSGFPGAGVSLMARIERWDATVAKKADITSITWTSYDILDSSAAVVSGTLTVSDVIFDTLQTDARWTEDTTGYNFRWDALATIAPVSKTSYQILATVTPASGEVFYLAYQIKTLDIIGK